MTTYKIVRHFKKYGEKAKVMKRGLTLAEAQTHCNDPKTSNKHDNWFDGYTEE